MALQTCCVTARPCSRFCRFHCIGAAPPTAIAARPSALLNVSVARYTSTPPGRPSSWHHPGIRHPAEELEGCGGMRLANWLYNVARGCTALGAVSRPGVRAAAGNKSAHRRQEFSHIGSANDESQRGVSWHTSGIKTFSDAQTTNSWVSGRGPASPRHLPYPAISTICSAQVPMVPGYPGGNYLNLAGAWRGARWQGVPHRWSTVKATRRFDRREEGQVPDAVRARQARRSARRCRW